MDRQTQAQLASLVDATSHIQVDTLWFGPGYPALPRRLTLAAFSDPWMSYGHCVRVSEKWVVETSYITNYWALETVRVERPGDDLGHTAAAVTMDGQKYVIDWTFSQFAHPWWNAESTDEPHPYVGTYDEWYERVSGFLAQGLATAAYC